MENEEVPLVRIAEALESIAKNLEKIANPPMVGRIDDRGNKYIAKA
jgi:hypothetical protein